MVSRPIQWCQYSSDKCWGRIFWPNIAVRYPAKVWRLIGMAIPRIARVGDTCIAMTPSYATLCLSLKKLWYFNIWNAVCQLCGNVMTGYVARSFRDSSVHSVRLCLRADCEFSLLRRISLWLSCSRPLWWRSQGLEACCEHKSGSAFNILCPSNLHHLASNPSSSLLYNYAFLETAEAVSFWGAELKGFEAATNIPRRLRTKLTYTQIASINEQTRLMKRSPKVKSL